MQEENNDFEFEDVTEDGAVGDKLQKLRSELKDAKEESQKNLDGWQRALADYANLQKTSGSQIKELREYTLQTFIEELFPVLDAFEMAMKNRESWESVSENWRKGVEYIYSQAKAILTNNGVEAIEKVGEKFNPEFHHAVEEISTDDEAKDHQISEIVQKGYRTSKSVIRPAQVKIFIKK